jgi:CelD/BcsL family acetyltransferase involved in cellulose biosynthesis
MLRVEEVATTGGFQEIRDEWSRFLDDISITSPFLSYDWFECCVTAYGSDNSLSILLVRTDQRIEGIAPLWRAKHVHRGVTMTALGFISGPDTPYVDFIVREEAREAALAAVVEHLFSERRDWDLMLLAGWPVESPNYQMFLSLIESRRAKNTLRTTALSPYLTIECGWQEYLLGRSPKFRKTRRNILNRMSRLGDVEVELHHRDPDGSVLDSALSVSSRSWKEKQGFTILQQEGARAFFKALTERAQQKNWLMIWLLKLDGKPVAMEYDLVYEGFVQALRADYDLEYATHSPGAYLESRIMERLFDMNCREYCTGPGLNPYKLRWTESLRKTMTIKVYGGTMRGKVAWWLDFLARMGRGVMELGRRMASREDRAGGQ